jgi:hypothetical protein
VKLGLDYSIQDYRVTQFVYWKDQIKWILGTNPEAAYKCDRNNILQVSIFFPQDMCYDAISNVQSECRTRESKIKLHFCMSGLPLLTILMFTQLKSGIYSIAGDFITVTNSVEWNASVKDAFKSSHLIFHSFKRYDTLLWGTLLKHGIYYWKE